MITPLFFHEFCRLNHPVPVLDVRTPAEFAHGHIPGAFNLPLFSNEERVMVGTTYKQEGREKAILLGFDLTGAKWSGFIKNALEISPDKRLAVHCWRGGMRSGAMAWALELYGFEVYLIKGGYKNYRRWVHQQFGKSWRLTILGGMTGSGKTKMLQQLQALGEQVIDLEDLAKHRGSSYGSMNTMVQPTQEQFENNLAACLSVLEASRQIWVEDESITIGKRFVPKPFWQQMKDALLIDMTVTTEQRVAFLVKEYGYLDKDFLVECTERIRKRLGPEQTKYAILAIRENRMDDFIRLVLVYYDKTYRLSLANRIAGNILSIEITGDDITGNAQQIISATQTVQVS